MNKQEAYKKLNDVLQIPEDKYGDYTLHFAIINKDNHNRNPLTEFRNGNFKAFQERQSKKNFNRPYILSLIRINEKDISKWLFAGIYEVLGCGDKNPKDENKYMYETKLTEKHQELIGKMIVECNRGKRGINAYPSLETFINEINIISM